MQMLAALPSDHFRQERFQYVLVVSPIYSIHEARELYDCDVSIPWISDRYLTISTLPYVQRRIERISLIRLVVFDDPAISLDYALENLIDEHHELAEPHDLLGLCAYQDMFRKIRLPPLIAGSKIFKDNEGEPAYLQVSFQDKRPLIDLEYPANNKTFGIALREGDLKCSTA